MKVRFVKNWNGRTIGQVKELDRDLAFRLIQKSIAVPHETKPETTALKLNERETR